MYKNICSLLVELFEKEHLSLFKYDISKNLIYIDKKIEISNEYHEALFFQLQIITNKLVEIDCDYSIDTEGNIIFNCQGEDLKCDTYQ